MNGVRKNVVFDTGASQNMLCSGVLEDLPEVKINPCEKEYYYFDGGKGCTIGTVNFEVEYNDKRYVEEFNVVNRNTKTNILLSNTTVKKLLNTTCKIPVEVV
jgi:hypothetical protein